MEMDKSGFRRAVGALDGLRLSGGMRYVGYRWADAGNAMKVPTYTLSDASGGYDAGKVGLKGADVRLTSPTRPIWHPVPT